MIAVPDAESRVRAIVIDQQDAWNAGDPVAYSARFHPNGAFTNIRGDVWAGYEAFERSHARIFATVFKGSRLRLAVRRIFFPVPGTAIVDVDAELEGFQALPPGVPTPPDGVLHTRLLEVMVEDGEGWWVVAYHNVDLKPGASEMPTMRDRRGDG